MKKNTFYLLLFLMSCIFHLALGAEEGSGESSQFEASSNETIQARLLKVLDAYEAVLVKKVGESIKPFQAKTNIQLSASNPKGEEASFGFSLDIKGDPKNKKMWAELTGDFGHALMSFDAKQGQAFLPEMSMSSQFDMNELDPSQKRSSLTEMKTPNDMIRQAMKNVRESVLKMDTSQLTLGKPTKHMQELCDVIVSNDPNQSGKLYISQASQLIRGIQLGKDKRELQADFRYHNKLPAQVTGRATSEQGLGARSEFALQLGYQGNLVNQLNFHVNAKVSDVKVLFKIQGTIDYEVQFAESDLTLALDPQARQVPMESLGQSLMLGSLGKLMQFQRFFMPPPPATEVPGSH